MLSLKPKQQTFIDALNNPQYDTYILIGAVGTGKTDVVAHAVISICDAFKDTFWPVFRKNVTTITDTIWPSYINMLTMMGFVEGEDYKLTSKPYIITFLKNNSTIRFREADRTKDRSGQKIKGINATGNHIDEADELEEEMFLQATSRKGRRNTQGQPSISLVTMNPNNGWAKERYYDKWKAGTLPENVCVLEFDINDSWQTDEDIRTLKQFPNVWQQRYLYNNWDFADDNASMFKYATLNRAHISVLEDGPRYAALDVARYGNDRSIASIWQGNQLMDIQVMKGKEDKVDNITLANKYMQYCKANNVGYENATVDAVGNGSGVVDHLHQNEQFYVKEFIAGGKAEGNYNNKRSETTHMLAQAFEKGEVKIFDSCPFLKELKSELIVQNYEIKEKVLKLEGKDKVKERLGVSPDVADAVMMAYSLQINTGLVTADDIAM